jgi:hypothetical protein
MAADRRTATLRWVTPAMQERGSALIFLCHA